MDTEQRKVGRPRPRRFAFEPCFAPGEEMCKQERDIISPPAQRRNGKRQDIEPVIKILPERAFGHRPAQVFLGRSYDPDIDRDLLVRAQPHDRAFLQDAKQARLHIKRHALDFIEEQRTAVGKLELAQSRLDRSREGPDLMTKQFAFDDRFRQSPAIDGNELSWRARRQPVQAFGNQLLACPGLAKNEHIGVGCGKVLKPLA